MFNAIIKFFKALFTVVIGILILAAVIVGVATILNACGLQVEFIDKIAVWILSYLSKFLVWLYNIIIR